MRSVWRYNVPVGDRVLLRVPGGWPGAAHVAARGSADLSVWLEVDTDAAAEDVTLTATGTGHPAPEGGERVGTALAPLGLVWHLWRVP